MKNRNSLLSIISIVILITFSIIVFVLNKGFYFASFNEQIALRTDSNEHYEQARNLTKPLEANPITRTIYYDNRDFDTVDQYAQQNASVELYTVVPNTKSQTVYATAVILPVVILMGLFINYTFFIRQQSNWKRSLQYYGLSYAYMLIVTFTLSIGLMSSISRVAVVSETDTLSMYIMLISLAVLLSIHTSVFMNNDQLPMLLKLYARRTLSTLSLCVVPTFVLSTGLVFAGGLDLVVSAILLVAMLGFASLAILSIYDFLQYRENLIQKVTRAVAQQKNTSKQKKKTSTSHSKKNTSKNTKANPHKKKAKRKQKTE